MPREEKEGSASVCQPSPNLVIGSPGRIIRQLSAEDIADLHTNASNYVAAWQDCQRKLRPID